MCAVQTLWVALLCLLASSTNSETENVRKVSKPSDVFFEPVKVNSLGITAPPKDDPAVKHKEVPVLSKLVLAPDTREPLAQGRVKFGSAKSAQYSKWNTFGRDTYDSGDLDDMSRVAPTSGTDSSGFAYGNITESRLRTIRSQFLYWFFDQGGNDGNGDYQKDIHSSSPTIHKNFNFQLPFFGFRFNYTRLSMHGYLEFSDPPDHYTYPLSFPNQDWPKKNDPAFIGIFFSKTRIGSIRPTDVDQRRPGVYFRMERDLQSRTDKFGVEMRERVMWDIRTGVVGADTFYPKHAAIITWKNMSFAGGIDNSLYRTNTFQMVLATDEVFTYAIFNYVNIQWTTHTEAGGDTTGGEGGVPAYIGFNAGNGTRSTEYKPYSQTTAIRDLTGRGWANGFPGRHIFRIDENILLGTCNKDIAGANLQLMFAPESGNMLGGTVVNITGPCFTPEMKVRCRFDIADVVGTVVDTNRAICVQPFVMAEGYVILDVAIGDGAYNWKGKYFIETPATAQQRIFFDTESIHQSNPTQIRFTWDSKNLTSLSTASVKIELYGYRETTITPELLLIDTIEDGITNSGSYTIVPANYKNRNNYLTNDMRFGFLKLSLTNPTQYSGLSVSPVIWSRPIPVGWYFAAQWQNIYGSNWANAMCDEWIMNDRYLKNFAAEVAQCPCTLQHALADKGRFMPDFDCDRDTNPLCRYNKGAVQCVKTGSPSYEGSEQQCCYDKNHYLMLSYDQQWGSRPKRSHNFGYLPWVEANKVPTLSQWYHDISPFYFCCLWQEEQAVGCETFRFERRPSQDCVAYQSPYVATVFGDPHIITFDALEYTFNGKGEFVLVHTDSPKFKLDVQGRFEQLPDNFYGEVRATQLTSIAGVTVYQPMYILNQSQIIMMFQSGAGIEVIENRGYMTARVYLPWKFINQTRGLMGNWSFDISDDFTKPDGTQATVTNLNNFERLHKDFAIYWLLEDREDTMKGPSLFFREYRRTASYYANKTFVPEWKRTPEEIIPSNRSQDIAWVNAYCGDSYQCKYDLAVSLDRDLAFYTLKYQDAYTGIVTTNKYTERIITCGILETPRFGRKSNFFFVPGTKVTFECNQDFVLVGDQRRTCTASGSWDVPVYGYTECLRMVEYDLQKILITVMIVIIILLPLLIILLCCLSYYVRKARGDGSSASWRYLTSPINGRRSSVASRQESVPLKSASNLIDADSGLGMPVKEDIVVPKKAKNVLQTQPAKQDDPDWKYDGVYFTNEPIPGLPEIEFEDKIWDFNDEDVFSSRTNSTFSSPFSDRNGSSVEYSKPIKQNRNDNIRKSRENIPSQIMKPIISPPLRLDSTGSTSASSSPLPVVIEAVAPKNKIVEVIPPPQKVKPTFVLPPTTLISSQPAPNPNTNDPTVKAAISTRSSITTAI